MKKNILTIILIAGLNNCFAQKTEHRLYLGINLTSTGQKNTYPDYYKSFGNPKIGMNAGYGYRYLIIPSIAVEAGIAFKTIQGRSVRGTSSNSPTGEIYPDLKERFVLSRLSVPVQGNFVFLRKEAFKIYAAVGLNFILVNNARRTADYYIPVAGTSFYDKFTYKGKESIKFGKNKSIGTNVVLGLGTDFILKKQRFNVELSFCNDLSKSKFPTFKNIERDGAFYPQFKSFQLNLGYILPKYK